MKTKVVLSFAGAALLTAVAGLRSAQSRPVYHETFLPPNSLRIPVSAASDKSITQDQFNAVMDRAEAIYGPIIAAKGGKLVLNRLWDDETVNASAQRNGNDWVVNMYGGLARHPTITQDGMALVVCHELGHHLGGAPKYGGMDWASNEGQADYFANSKCLHRMFADSKSKVFTRMTTAGDGDDQIARDNCAKSYKDAKDQAICFRSAMAGMSVTALFTALSGDAPAHFNTPDPSVVPQTNDEHPASQCRLDTYYQASLCPKSYTVDMDDADPAVGACVASQGYKVGLRPLCWYTPPATEPKAAAPSEVASMERQSKAAASKTLAALDTSVFSGL